MTSRLPPKSCRSANSSTRGPPSSSTTRKARVVPCNPALQEHPTVNLRLATTEAFSKSEKERKPWEKGSRWWHIRAHHWGLPRLLPAKHIVFSHDRASDALWKREETSSYRKKSAHCSWRANTINRDELYCAAPCREIWPIPCGSCESDGTRPATRSRSRVW